jgi:asparagine synthase (glutamine-hydrolysing)
MCGIAGLLHLDGAPVDLDRLQQMTRSLAHRGPDGSGTLVDGSIGLGHQRLAILDPEGGIQPMKTEDGTLSIAFNGQVFNHVELREQLCARRYRFSTRSDTEVVLQLYREHGPDCVRLLNGDWAFALWDRSRRRLLLSRDRMGVRPLFYTVARRTLVFGSEIKALFAFPAVPRALDLEALDQIFTFWTPLTPRTLFKDVFELAPGHSLIVEDGLARPRRYWDLWTDVKACDGYPERHYSDQLLELVTDATRLRLRADVPVGALVSGGLDSTFTASLAAGMAPHRMQTFSVTFDDPALDEREFQRAAVERIGTEHVECHCSESDVARVFPDVVWHAERPMLRAAPAAMYLLSQQVHEQGYKVVLTGEGADETLGGYDIYKEAKIRQFWSTNPTSTWRPRLLRRLYPYMDGLQAQGPDYLRAFFQVTPEDCASPFFSHLPRWRLTARLKRFFSPDLRAELRGSDPLETLRTQLPGAYDGWELQRRGEYLETEHLLPGYILSTQGDRMSMAHGVEGRFPFLDHRLVAFAASVPSRLKLHVLNEKYLLKRIARDFVPPAIVSRKKQPFRAPDARSFIATDGSTPGYVAELLGPKRLSEDGLFDPSAVRYLVAKAASGRPLSVKDNMALVGILSTELLVERFIRNLPDANDSSGSPTFHR